MPTCSACGTGAPDGSAVCPSCGTRLDATAPDEATRTAPTAAKVAAAGRTSIDSRFLPGTTIAGRYRIVGLLGKGGMGEVYRADDLKLGQAVALKFLPEAFASDRGRLDRLFNEVRMARRVSHPNVCRVWDIDEAERHHFVAMEFVDGEDLASLLRRIGRLPHDKAVQIARQLCAGLAAAHDQGILHRDLKPANVMIDGRGHVRLTDFGLAAAVAGGGDDARSGTPLYMAPEQLAGDRLSVQTDLYALGLVLHEIFTGKRVLDATDRDELARQRESASTGLSASRGADASSGEVTLSPAVRQAIERCLQIEPGERPASARAVAAALPGGDPLAAAVAAGETPSPALVAEAGGRGGLEPRFAVPLLVGTIAMLLVTMVLNRATLVTAYVPTDLAPWQLAARAEEIVQGFGYGDRLQSTATAYFAGFPGAGRRRVPVYEFLSERDASGNRWDVLETGRPPLVTYWFVGSPAELVSGGLLVTPVFPPRRTAGLKTVELDLAGRLLFFEAVPPETGDALPATPDNRALRTPPADWAPAFEAAGLDIAAFAAVAPERVPLFGADEQAAWTGEFPELPGAPIRIEAAAHDGRLVYFELIGPWSVLRRAGPPRASGAASVAAVGQTIGVTAVLVAMVLALVAARRNLRLGRGDRRGAARLAGAIAFFVVTGGVLVNISVPAAMRPSGLAAVFWTGSLVLVAVSSWLLYLALEPYLRRRWPQSLTAWTRLLDGRLRDPLVGRDVLIGIAAGLLGAARDPISHHLQASVGAFPEPRLAYMPEVGASVPAAWGGPTSVLGNMLFQLAGALAVALVFVLLLHVLHLLFRRLWLAGVVYVLLFGLTDVNQQGNQTILFVGTVLVFSLGLFVLIRFGVLAFVACQVSQAWSVELMPSWDFAPWYGSGHVVVLLVVLGLAGYAFHTALAGRPVIADPLAERPIRG